MDLDSPGKEKVWSTLRHYECRAEQDAMNAHHSSAIDPYDEVEPWLDGHVRVFVVQHLESVTIVVVGALWLGLVQSRYEPIERIEHGSWVEGLVRGRLSGAVSWICFVLFPGMYVLVPNQPGDNKSCSSDLMASFQLSIERIKIFLCPRQITHDRCLDQSLVFRSLAVVLRDDYCMSL